jgi:DNA-binding CsgD family transcriptional regulator
MKGSADIISLVEAAYDVEAADSAWLQRLIEVARPMIDRGLGLAAFLFDLSKHPVETWSVVSQCVLSAEDIGRVVSTLDQGYMAGARMVPVTMASEIPGYDDQTAISILGDHGVADTFAITAIDPSGVGLWLGAPTAKRGTLGARDRLLWSRVSAHIASGHRLRRTLATARVEAVMAPSGDVVHAEADAVSARSALREATVAFDRARGRLRKDATEATASWRGLVGARWSLVDSFESDGKRYVVARVNETTAGPQALSTRERQVLGYAALGHATKQIAYELGIAETTVRVLLARAVAKLGAKNREQAVQKWRQWLAEE